jgi:uncharacterized damage-inducible protein DinB
MSENFPARIFEHNNWANQRILDACLALTDEQLDAVPRSVVKGTIRETLSHLVNSQAGYLSLLTLPVEERQYSPVEFSELQESLRKSGEGLLALARGQREPLAPRLRTRDEYLVDPWVVMLQVINHAYEHREQICSILNALGVIPPDMDGWSYSEAAGALVPISK